MKFFRYFFPFLAAAGILYLTLQTPSETLMLSGSFHTWLAERGIAVDEGSLRNAAHIAEYGVLGITLCFSFGWKKALWMCPLYGLFDELLKILLPTRHFSWIDIFMDIIGTLLAILISETVLKRLKNSI